MKTLIPILFTLLFSYNTIAQNGKHERLKSLKVSFITERLDLSENEAQKFWPVYNDYEKKTGQIRHNELKALRKDIRNNIDQMTNEEANVVIDKLTNVEMRLITLRQENMKKLSEILSPVKLLKLKMAESDFKKRMLNELKKRRKE